jgi:hypothetical protein
VGWHVMHEPPSCRGIEGWVQPWLLYISSCGVQQLRGCQVWEVNYK